MADAIIRGLLERLCIQLDQDGSSDLSLLRPGGDLTNMLSPKTLSTVFCVAGGPTTTENLSIDNALLQSSFGCVAKHERASQLVSGIIQQHIVVLVQRLRECPEDIALLRTMSMYLLCTAILKLSDAERRKLLVSLAQTLLQLKENSKSQFHAMEGWLGNDKVLFRKMVLIFHKGLTVLMKIRAYADMTAIEIIHTFIAVLATLNKINEDHGYPVSRRLFWINGLDDDDDLIAHHFSLHAALVIQAQDAALLPKEFFTWLDVPFLLNVKTKWKFLCMEAKFIQQGQKERARFENFARLQFSPSLFATGFPQVPIPFVSATLQFHVDRKNIIQSAIENVRKYWQDSDEPNIVWLNPLKVNFKAECAQDLGGPSKDFFHHLFIALMDQKFKFFTPFDEKSVSSDVWFDTENRDLQTLEQIGLLFALLVFNGAIVTVPFPVQLYEKLLSNKDPTLSDLKEMDPEFVKSLFSLREKSADDLECLCFDFEGLQVGGEHMLVDKDNVEQFIEDKITKRLALRHLEVFARGFNRVASLTPLMRALFKAEDLRDVILGEELNWEAFIRSATYKPPYCEDHPVIQMFWKVFRDLEERDKRKFMRFLTGADHVPLRGFVPFPIRRLDNKAERYRDRVDPTNYPDPDELTPEVMTCEGYLSMDLPEYSNEEVLRYRLMVAMDVTGFHRETPC